MVELESCGWMAELSGEGREEVDGEGLKQRGNSLSIDSKLNQTRPIRSYSYFLHWFSEHRERGKVKGKAHDGGA